MLSHTPAGSGECTDERRHCSLDRLLTTAERTVAPQLALALALPDIAQDDQFTLLDRVDHYSIQGEFVK